MSTLREHLEAIRDRLTGMIDANPCWLAHPERHRPADACRKGDCAFCDQCAIRWDAETARFDAQAALAILDDAEADMFDEDTGMVALIPDGAVWELANGVGPWQRKT